VAVPRKCGRRASARPSRSSAPSERDLTEGRGEAGGAP
jgi:hypothetical protein